MLDLEVKSLLSLFDSVFALDWTRKHEILWVDEAPIFDLVTLGSLVEVGLGLLGALIHDYYTAEHIATEEVFARMLQQFLAERLTRRRGVSPKRWPREVVTALLLDEQFFDY